MNCFIFSVSEIVKAVAGCIYEIAPNYAPRKMSTIMSKFVDKLHSHSDTQTNINRGYNTFYFFEGDFTYIEKILREVLWDIPEFLELNLTWNEFERGLRPGDEDREDSICFVSRYGSSIDNWKDDFIDLDAVVQNVIYILKLEEGVIK